MPKRRGRPSLGERVPLGLRVTPEMKRRLDDAAKRSGRSQSQEAEFRLERSFDRAGLLPEVLRLEYDRDLGGILMLLGHAMLWADVFDRVDKKRAAPWRWASDADGYNAAVEAAVTILEALRPREPISGEAGRASGTEVATTLLAAVMDGTDFGLVDDENIEAIRALLGPRLEAMREPQGNTDRAGQPAPAGPGKDAASDVAPAPAVSIRSAPVGQVWEEASKPIPSANWPRKLGPMAQEEIKIKAAGVREWKESLRIRTATRSSMKMKMKPADAAAYKEWCADAYTDYKEWCKERGLEPVTPTAFSNIMKLELGVIYEEDYKRSLHLTKERVELRRAGQKPWSGANAPRASSGDVHDKKGSKR